MTDHNGALVLTEDQQALREVVRSVCERGSTLEHVRTVMETDDGADRALWHRLSEEIGVAGLPIPEDYGGAGTGYAEVAVVAEELGRHLACVPFLASSVLATSLLLASDDDAAKTRWLPRLAAGEILAAAVLDGVLTASSEGESVVIDGQANLVIDGAGADVFLVAVDAEQLFIVAADAAGVQTRQIDGVDLTRRIAEVTFANATAQPIAVDASAAVRTASANGRLALAAEAVGGMRAVLDSVVDYVRTREQFDRPIGSFQAVKHACADLLIDTEAAASALAEARSLANGGDAPRFLAAVDRAFAYAAEAYVRVADDGLHLFGGIGFTWEHHAHMYYRRAYSISALLGGTTQCREDIAESVFAGLPALTS